MLEIIYSSASVAKCANAHPREARGDGFTPRRGGFQRIMFRVDIISGTDGGTDGCEGCEL